MRSLQTLARNCARTLPLPPPVIFLFLRILRVQSVGLRVSSLGWELRISSGDPHYRSTQQAPVSPALVCVVSIADRDLVFQ
jgi:hypothetical protein